MSAIQWVAFLFVDKKSQVTEGLQCKERFGEGRLVGSKILKSNLQSSPFWEPAGWFLGPWPGAGCSDGGVGRTRRLAGLRGECTQMHCTALRCIPRLYLYLYLPLSPPAPPSSPHLCMSGLWTLAFLGSRTVLTDLDDRIMSSAPITQTCIQSNLL